MSERRIAGTWGHWQVPWAELGYSDEGEDLRAPTSQILQGCPRIEIRFELCSSRRKQESLDLCKIHHVHANQ